MKGKEGQSKVPSERGGWEPRLALSPPSKTTSLTIPLSAKHGGIDRGEELQWEAMMDESGVTLRGA